MTNEATQQGVEEDNDKKTVEPTIDTSSLDYMEQIADQNYEKDRKAEIEAAKEEGREPSSWATEKLEDEEEGTASDENKDEESEETDEESEETTSEDEEEEEDDSTDENQSDDTNDSTSNDTEIEIVVDGKKQKVPMSKIIDAGTRTLQKETAADKRLEEATKLLKDAKSTTSRKEGTTESKTTDEDIKQLRLDYIKKVQYSDAEEAAEALEKWESAVLSKTSTASKATETTEDASDLRSEIKKINLEDRIFASPLEGGYKDLFDSPILKKHTAALVDSLVEKNEGSYDSFDTYRKAGDAIRKIAKTLDSSYALPKLPKKTSADSFEKKKGKKKKIVNLPASSTKAGNDDTDDKDKDESVQDVIAQMREERGQ